MYGFGENPEPPTQGSKKWSEFLKLYTLILVIAAISKMCLYSRSDSIKMQFLNQGFNDLIVCLLLYCGANSLSYCMITIFFFMTFMNIMWIVSTIGRGFQVRDMNGYFSSNAAALAVVFAALVVYLVGRIDII